MNISQKKSKVTKINTRHVALKVEKPSVELPSVAALAYQFWLDEGRHGSAQSHWLRAEQQIKNAQKPS